LSAFHSYIARRLIINIDKDTVKIRRGVQMSSLLGEVADFGLASTKLPKPTQNCLVRCPDPSYPESLHSKLSQDIFSERK
jgi:hypothetical protein